MGAGIGLQNRWFRSALSFVVAGLLIGSISYIGVHTFQASRAASGPTIYASPASATVQNGATLSVTIREDSGSDTVNSVQASMSYDSNTLQFASITEGGAFPLIAATSTNTPGIIRVARANADADQAGDKPIVTVNFKVIGTSGSGTVNFDKAYSILVRSTDNHNILQNVSGGTYSIASSPVPTTKPVMYLSPAGGSFNVGSTVSATVRLNAFDTAVSTVEAIIGYPSNLLQYTGVTENGVFTTVQRTNANAGSIDMIRGVAGGSGGITGDKAVVTMNFKVLGPGAAALTINGGSAAYDTSGSGSNVLNQAGSAGASYSLVAAGGSGPTPSPTPSPSPPAAGDTSASSAKGTAVTTPSQALTIGTKGSDGHISLITGDDGAPLTELGGEVELAPVINQAIFAENPGDSITKVEYYLDGKLISTQKQPPYTYKFDSKTMRNGTYAMTVKTYFKSGNVDTKTDKLLVNNKVDLAYVMRNFTGSIVIVVIILAVLAILIWKLVIPRARIRAAAEAAAGHENPDGRADSAAEAGAGLVAEDPTVIAPVGPGEPVTGPDDLIPSSGGGFSSAPYAASNISTAAQTTQALPMTPLAVPTPDPVIAPKPEPVASVGPAPAMTGPLLPDPAPAPDAESNPVPSSSFVLNHASAVHEPTLKPASTPAASVPTVPPASAAPAASAPAAASVTFNDKYVTSAPRPDYTSAPAASKPIKVKIVDESPSGPS